MSRGWRYVAFAGLALIAVALVGVVLLGRPKSTSSISPISRVNTQDYHSLLMAPGNPDVVFFGHHGGILKSVDGGKSWTKGDGIRQDAMNLVAARQNPETMYLAGHNVFMKSADGGDTWQNVPNNLPGLDLHWFAMHPDDPDRLYTNAVGFGLFKSTNGGATWSPWNVEIPGDTPVTAIGILGGDPEAILAGTEDGLILRSEGGGTTWQEVNRINSMVMSFAYNPESGAIYVGTMNGVYRSEGGGASWTSSALDTPVMAMAVGGGGPERVLVVNDEGEVFRSDDGGTTW